MPRLNRVAVAADGITVTGTGESQAKPTSVEINVIVTADAQLTADAVVKFNDVRKRCWPRSKR